MPNETSYPYLYLVSVSFNQCHQYRYFNFKPEKKKDECQSKPTAVHFRVHGYEFVDNNEQAIMEAMVNEGVLNAHLYLESTTWVS